MSDTNAKILAIQEQIAGIQRQLAGLQSQLSELLEVESAEIPEKYWGDMSAKVVSVTPASEPGAPNRRRKETMRDLFLLEVKEQFCDLFSASIEDATIPKVRHRLLNVVADWGNEGFMDALYLKEKGDEFWNQARRIMDKIEAKRKAKQSA